MERREVYATTGPRMMVRFFGGWEFDEDRQKAGRGSGWASSSVSNLKVLLQTRGDER
jgi:hypothetical protein